MIGSKTSKLDLCHYTILTLAGDTRTLGSGWTFILIGGGLETDDSERWRHPAGPPRVSSLPSEEIPDPVSQRTVMVNTMECNF